MRFEQSLPCRRVAVANTEGEYKEAKRVCICQEFSIESRNEKKQKLGCSQSAQCQLANEAGQSKDECLELEARRRPKGGF